jgi:multicomponent Na+:H+ antiporter subunit E
MLRAVAIRAVLLFAVWLLLTQSLDVFHLGLGGVSALVIARLHSSGRSTGGVRWARLPIYIPWLVWQVLLSGWHLSLLILDPKMPIKPKLFTFETTLRDPAALAIFGNSITLTPGTITAEAMPGELVVHAMDDVSAAGLRDMEQKIVRVFGVDRAPGGPGQGA